jgi:hypothetical protein
MEIKPVKEIKEPLYPRKDEVTLTEIQEKVPKRWRASNAAKVALGALAVVSLAGCKPQVYAGVPMPAETETEQTVAVSNTPDIGVITAGIPAPTPFFIAPLFEHGEGFGVMSEIEQASTAFLSEEEVLAIINEVAEQYGLVFSQESTAIGIMRASAAGREEELQYISMTLDFMDREHGIVIEYVSAQDAVEWSGEEATDETKPVDTKYAAQELYDSIVESVDNFSGEELYCALLYDPCSQDKETSITELKAQAQDFFEWLASEGLI